MTLPSSGPISFSNVDVELGYSATATISLNDTAVRTLFGVSSGQISMSNGYGKSNNKYWVLFRGSYSAGQSPNPYCGDSDASYLVNTTTGNCYNFYRRLISSANYAAGWLLNSDGSAASDGYYNTSYTGSWGYSSSVAGINGTNYHPTGMPGLVSKGSGGGTVFTGSSVGMAFAPVKINTGVQYYQNAFSDSSSNSAFVGVYNDTKMGYRYVGITFVSSGGTVTNYFLNSPYGGSTEANAIYGAMTTDGNTFYVGGQSNRIIKITKGSPATLSSFSIGETYVGGLCADSSNNFYTLGYSSNQIRKYDSSFTNTLTKNINTSYPPNGLIGNSLSCYGNYLYAYGNPGGGVYVSLVAFNTSDLSVAWSVRVNASGAYSFYAINSVTATAKGIYGTFQKAVNKLSWQYYTFKFPLNGAVTNTCTVNSTTFTPSTFTTTVSSASTTANTTLKATTNMTSSAYSTGATGTFTVTTLPAPYVSSQWT